MTTASQRLNPGMSRYAILTALLMAALLSATAAVAVAAPAPGCTVVEGVIADVAPGPFVEETETVTLRSAWRAEFRWDLIDRQSIGWMRILDQDGRLVGWVPAGHEGVRCGQPADAAK